MPTNIEKVNDRYRPRILALLGNLKKALEALGYVCDEPDEGFSDTDYPYNLTAHPKGNEGHKVYTDLSIVDAYEYDGLKGRLNFEWKVQLDGGRTPFSFAPNNFTPDVWVKASDAAAVEERFKLMEDPDTCQAVCEAMAKELETPTRVYARSKGTVHRGHGWIKKPKK